jgi:EmrB/QacA subfamily drug resistance transporter
MNARIIAADVHRASPFPPSIVWPYEGVPARPEKPRRGFVRVSTAGGGLRYGERAGRWVLFATVLGSAVAFIDGTVVNIALPRIGRDFGTGAAGLQWTVNAYTLTLASFVLLGGSLGDQFGRRKIFLTGMIWFAGASLLCGLAPNIELLIAARALQGVGGGLLTPGALAILQSSFAQQDRMRAIGAWSGLAGAAGAIGPFLGGWLVEFATWRLVFLINVPVALVVVVVSLRHVPESFDVRTSGHIDAAGALLGATGLAGLTYGFTAWPGRAGSDPVVLSTLLIGISGLVGFVVHESRSAHPMLPLGLFRSRTFSATNIVTFAVYAALGGVFFLVVVNLQVVVGFTPLTAGISMLPVTVLMLFLSPRAGWLATRIGPRLPMTFGPFSCAVALLLLSRVGPGTTYVSGVLPAAIILGLGLSLTVTPLTATALASVEDRHAGVASGVNNAVARIAGLLAVAILPLASGLGSSLTDPIGLAPAYRSSMLICAGLLVLGGVLAFVAIPSTFAAITPPNESAGASDQAQRSGSVPAITNDCGVTGPPLQPTWEDPA